MNTITYSKDSQQLATLTLNRTDAAVNKLDGAFRSDLKHCLDQLEAEKDSLRGVILCSGKDTFFAGADLEELLQYKSEQKLTMAATLADFKQQLTRLETLGIPVVACLNGSALGGGWELALACHHRIAIDHPKVRFGLPEVKLGLLPGGGGIVRMVRLLGLEAALPLLVEGRELQASAMRELGLVHDLAVDADDLIKKAKAWLHSGPMARQPWQEKAYRIPGGTPQTPKLAMKLPAAPAFLLKKTHGCYPAPEAILKAAVEGLNVDFETALKIESRYFIELLESPVSHNMIKTFFFDLNAVNKGASRPDKIIPRRWQKVGVLGAGMMGAGIAYAAAKAGIEVILKDVDQQTAERGKDYSRKIMEKKINRQQSSQEAADSLLARITATSDLQDLSGCEMIIEAVFEDRQLKATVTQESEVLLNQNGIFASNTSTLPITGLAKAAKRPDRFIGLHFFSPVDKMQLVEIIVGEKTSDETLAQAFDFVRQIKKTPIVVNDSRGFFTSRVFGTFTNEGIAMLGEGVLASSIEQAALQSGMPVGPLAVSDEVSLSLMMHILAQTEKDLAERGIARKPHPAETVIKKMVALGRPGRKAAAGFYDYPKQGRKHLWPKLAAEFTSQSQRLPFQDIKDRLLFIQAIETVRCLEEGVLRSSRDANIGSIFGIGFAPWSGGALQFINQYGLRRFTERAMELAEVYGERFQPPALLLEKAETQQAF